MTTAKKETTPGDPRLAMIEALAKFQAECRTVRKDSEADAGKFKYNYLSLAKLREATAEAMSDNGLVITQAEGFNETHVLLSSSLMHTAGYEVISQRPICTIDAALADAQRYGSAMSYARRYSYLALLGIAPEDEDDDGNAATDMDKTKGNGKAAPPKSKAPPKAPGKASPPKGKEPPDSEKTFKVSYVSDQGEIEEVSLTRNGKNVKGMIERCEASMENDNGWWWAHRDEFSKLCKAGGATIEIFSPSLGNLTFGEWCEAMQSANGEPGEEREPGQEG